MRLAAALVYLFAGMWLYFWLFPAGPFALGVALFFALMFTSVPLFNKGLLRKLKGQSHAEYLQDLAAQGKLADEAHQASRALYFEDLDTGSAAIFMDLDSKGILCLYGQHLYQYEPDDDASTPRRTRIFPCRQFTLRRLKKSGEILEVLPEGGAFEPAVIAQPPRRTLRELRIPMRDGDIYTHLRYDELLSAFARLNS